MFCMRTLVEFLASRWAVKEACHKALGNWRLPFPEIVLRSGTGGNDGVSGVSASSGHEKQGKTEEVGAIADALRYPLEHSLYRKE